jgi:hypothetical protein
MIQNNYLAECVTFTNVSLKAMPQGGDNTLVITMITLKQ